MKPDYIQKLESIQGVFSELSLKSISSNLIKFLDEKKLKRVYENSILVEKDHIEWHDIIYMTSHPFYLYVNVETTNVHKMTVYYQPEQFNELIIFIRIMLKQFENARTNGS